MKLTPFTKLFIANRGEIALRIMRTAKRMGLTVFVATPRDESDASHALATDRAVLIHSESGKNPFLDGPALIAAAKACGAEAVHPGYGFLAEDAEFAQGCIDAGLIFVGPSPAAMRQLGNKAEAKILMSKAGLTCIEGYLGEDQSTEAFASAAQKLGFPLMIKAKAGGGGRGMRLVKDVAALPGALAAARAEAEAAFGNGALMLERAVLRPRHVEVQVFGDRHGNLVHLFERDCSVQRRHQKLIEEAPAPGLTRRQSKALCEAAVKALAQVGYEGAGTMEFLIDAKGRSFFMEMNTRLQVEHQVTEMITGIDLVEWQLRIAMGEVLRSKQANIRIHGHAMEARLCAEDPARDFLPQTGEMAVFCEPLNVKVETALRDGEIISSRYDSLIAKLIVHGISRNDARLNLIRALEDTVALGVTTNRSFLARCLADPRFIAGKADTSFLDNFDRQPAAPDPFVLALLLYVSKAGARAAWPAPPLAAALPVPLRFESRLGVSDAHVSLARDGQVRVSIGASTRCFRIHTFDGTTCRFEENAITHLAALAMRADRLFLQYENVNESCRDATLAPPLPPEHADGDGGVVRAALGGRIIDVAISEGAKVQRGDPLLTIEAMKMQHVHRAARTGIVTHLRAKIGQQVREGDILATLSDPSPS